VVWERQLKTFLPHRDEGYGLSPSTVHRFSCSGTDLLITVDNGINARAAVRLAQRLGIDVVVIDHHRIQEQAETTAVWSDAFCGAALAAMFVWALALRRGGTIRRLSVCCSVVVNMHDCLDRRLCAAAAWHPNPCEAGPRRTLTIAAQRSGKHTIVEGKCAAAAVRSFAMDNLFQLLKKLSSLEPAPRTVKGDYPAPKSPYKPILLLTVLWRIHRGVEPYARNEFRFDLCLKDFSHLYSRVYGNSSEMKIKATQAFWYLGTGKPKGVGSRC
jgi:hypothetical protein